MSHSHLVLLLSPVIPATGNTSTITRLHEHLSKYGIAAKVYDAAKLDDAHSKCKLSKLNSLISHLNISGIVLLHAYKSGQYLVCSCDKHCSPRVKYGVVYGGTDLNEDLHDDKKCAVMKHVIRNAQFTVAFTKHMCQTAMDLCPESIVLVQQQSLDYDLFMQCKAWKSSPRRNYMKPFVLILPSSLRNVKDPIYVIESFLKWRETLHPATDIRILIMGAITDPAYGAKFFQKVLFLLHTYCNCKNSDLYYCGDMPQFECSTLLDKPIPAVVCETNDDVVISWVNNPSGSAVQYVPAVSRSKFLEYISQGAFCALLNSSKSEGMASSILEAMALGIPVVARDIPGNNAVIQEGYNGYLFSDPEDFLAKVKTLIDSPLLSATLVNNARTYVLEHHSPFEEAEFYAAVVEHLF